MLTGGKAGDNIKGLPIGIKADFVVDMDGNLHIGRGHSYLANGMDVQAAGTLKVNNNGQLRKITNASVHYAPTVSQG